MSTEPTQTLETGDFQSTRPARLVSSYLGYGMEAVWLLAAFAVPVVVLSPGLLLGHVETPKVGLVRSAAALLTILWVMRLVVAPRIVPRGLHPVSLSRLRWRFVGRWLFTWLRADPYRWALVALGALALAYLLSTTLSASPAISVWGRRPGGDGYGLYTMASMAVLGAAVAFNLRSRGRLYRLLGAISVAGTVVGAYAISQHFGFDPILRELANADRSQSSMGNPIFAGAVLVITALLTATLTMAAWTESRGRLLMALGLAALAVQVLGLIYTLSRGPWLGAGVGAGVLAVLVWQAVGWRRVRVPLAGMVAALAVAVAVASIAGAVRSGDGSASAAAASDLNPLARALSIYPETTGGLSTRYGIWAATLDLVSGRPWPDVAPQSNAWARHPFGYGPDLFRFVYPMVSPPSAIATFAFEAHNVPLHVLAELGIVGFAALIAAWVVVPAVGLTALWKGRATMPTAWRILQVGLLAIFVGRSVEMMVGIPRVADLMLLMLLVGVFSALPAIRWEQGADPRPAHPDGDDEHIQPSGGRTATAWAGLVGRAVAIWAVIVVLSVFTWMKTGNYALADGEARLGVAMVNRGETQEGLALVQRSIDLAPDVPGFHLLLGDVLDGLGGASPSADLRLRTTLGRFVNARNAVAANPFDPGPRTAQANAAVDLHIMGEEGFLEIAVEETRNVARMMPRFAISHFDAALMLLVAERPGDALESLDRGAALFDAADRPDVAADGLYLRGLALRQIGDLSGAAAQFRASIELDPAGRFASNARRALEDLGQAP